VPTLNVYGTFVGPQSLSINQINLNINGDISLGGNTSQGNITVGEIQQQPAINIKCEHMGT